MNKQNKLVFYLETFILTVSFIFVIAVLSRVFVTSAVKSVNAGSLTDAVCLSENVAEVMLSADSFEEFCELLNENGNAEIKGNTVTVSYSDRLEPLKGGEYTITASWTESGSNGSGIFVETAIKAFVKNGTEPIYVTGTGKYLSEVITHE